jgi:hypothetical protein
VNKLWKFRLMCLAACLVPVAGAALSRYLPIGRGPATARAATNSTELPVAFYMPSLESTVATTSTSAAVEALRTKPFARTPVWAPLRTDPNDATVTAQTHVDSVPLDAKRKAALADLKSVDVSSILTGRQPLAVIAGKSRKVGDEIRGGWKITSIDPATGIVDVQHPDGGAAQIHLRKKTIEDSAAGSSGVRPNPAR